MEYLKIWCSFAEIIEPLNDSERGRLFTAMLEYAESGALPEFKGNERYVWPMARQNIDKTREENGKQRANGVLGGRPKGNPQKPTETQKNPTEPNESLKEKEKEKENKENPINGVKEKTRFFPPTSAEVALYCQERGNDVDPEKFVDFYASKGWKVGNQPMKDWKAAVRTWEKKDSAPAKVVTAQQYGQRGYSEDYLLSVSDDLVEEARRRRDEGNAS
jgi:hypothetical protein